MNKIKVYQKSYQLPELPETLWTSPTTPWEYQNLHMDNWSRIRGKIQHLLEIS